MRSKKFLLFIILLVSILWVTGCSISGVRKTLPKGALEAELSLGFATVLDSSIFGIIPYPFPEIGINYGLTEKITTGLKFYPLILINGDLFLEPIGVINVYKGKNWIPSVNVGISHPFITDFHNYFGSVSGAVGFVWETQKLYCYLSPVFIWQYTSLPTFKYNVDIKAGIGVKISEKFELVGEFSINSIGKRTFVNFGFFSDYSIGVPVVYIGMAYRIF